MKNLTTALQAGNLTPKERVLALVHNGVAKDKTGTEVLSDADKHALHEGWRPENNSQVHEFNKFLRGWQILGAAELDAQTLFMNAQNAHLRKQPLMSNLSAYHSNREMRMWLERLTNMKCVDIHEALAITKQQKAVKLHHGLDIEYVVYKLAFERLSDADRARFIELYPDIEYDHQYLDQEEVIAHLLEGKETLNEANTEKLAALVAERSYNAFAKEYQLFHYFACIPLAEVARQFLIDTGIPIGGKALSQNQESDDEDDITHAAIQTAVENYAQENNISIETILKEACVKWIDRGLFDQYTPLAVSDDSELLKRWLTTKQEARAMLKKHITKGELKLKDRSPDETRKSKLYSKRIYDGELQKARSSMEYMGWEVHPKAEKGELDEKPEFATFSDTVITGESLYDFKSDYVFVRDFKKDVDTYNANLGLVYADTDMNTHLDRELLIADVNDAGELSAFSTFGMATQILGAYLKGATFFQESEKDTETWLEFKDAELAEAFADMRDSLITGYATLLAFQELFKRLSDVYNIDLTYKTQRWIDALSAHIDDHNHVLKRATGQLQDTDDKPFLKHRHVLRMERDFFIDKESIKPGGSSVAEYVEKFKEALGGDFLDV